MRNRSRCGNTNHPSCPTSSGLPPRTRPGCCTLTPRQAAPSSVGAPSHCSDEKRLSGGHPCPRERCLAEAYFGWACPNKHIETLQPQLQASPWLTSHPVTPPLTEREKTSQGERDKQPEPKPAEVRRAKRCLLSEPGLSHACSLVCAAAGMPVARECLANSSTIIIPCTAAGGGEVEFREEGLFNRLPKSRRVNGMQNAFFFF